MEDAKELAAFYEKTRRGLWAFLFQASGDAALAEDLVQEAYVRLLSSRAVACPEAERRAYLYRVASNLLKDSWRRSRRADDYVEELSAEVLSAPEPAGSRGLSPEAAAVGFALERLPPRQRMLLWLAYVDGFTHREIAGAVGVGEKSVRVLLARARKKVAALLGAPHDLGGLSS